MSTAVIALVCFAVAFISGSMLSKAYFITRGSPGAVDQKKLHALLQAQRIRYRKRLVALNNVVGRHEEVRDQIRGKVATIERSYADQSELLEKMHTELERSQQKNQELRRQLGDSSTSESDSSAKEKELAILRIERDELAARIVRMEADQAQTAEVVRGDHNKDEIACMRADMGELRETLATRDRNVHDLKVELQDSTERTKRLEAKLDDWRQRVAPLTRKLKQQKEVIQQFRECTRQNRSSDPADSTSPDEQHCDDLKAIRGIGPALERRLQKHGICRYEQIAELTTAELTEVAKQLAIAPNLAERDEWIQQARDLQEQSELFDIA